MKLIKNLGYLYATNTSKKKTLFGIYECPICLTHYRVSTANIKNGHTTKCRSCSAKIRQTTHGLSKHKLYTTWADERSRCYNVNDNSYKYYGARGIIVSDEFHNFKTWLDFVENLPNAYIDGYTIDRIDNDGNYSRENLKWSDKKTQTRNTRIIYSHNTSGYRGVSFNKSKGKWDAYIHILNKRKYLGRFKYPWTAAYSRDSYIIKNKLEHTRNF